MRIIVTGSAGFIGSHLTKQLLESGHDVMAVDRKTSPLESKRSLDLDLTRLEETVRNLKDADCVAHLAGILGVDKTETDPLKTLDDNILMAKNVLEACRTNDIKKIVFASSSEVYGDPEKVPIDERFIPQPISVYGVSKLACEQYVKAYSRAYGLDYCILRYFNVYGLGQSEDFIVSRFVSLALKNEPLTIFGDGLQIRCFAYVSDIANGTRMAIESSEVRNEIINLGDDRQPVTINDLARIVKELTPSRSTIRHVPLETTLRAGREIHRRIPDITKAKKLLGYTPLVSLQEGLDEVISSLKNKASRSG